MSDIQRWHLYSPIMREESETGEWVTYADHVAALAAEYERGQRDERARIRTGVTGLPWAFVDPPGVLDTVLAVIDPEEEQ